MPVAAIIADDLTGALDSAVHFGKQGYHAICHIDIGEEDYSSSPEHQVFVYNTRSRNTPVDRLEECLEPFIKKMSTASFLFKKIDSTLRGHIGRELEILIKRLSIDAVFFSPAFIETGRIVKEGNLWLNGVLLSETEVAEDLPRDCCTSDIASRIRFQTNLTVEHIFRSQYSDPMDLVKWMESKWAGTQVFSFDAEKDQDEAFIIELGKRFSYMGKKILWCGSAGLCKALSRTFPVLKPRSVILPEKKSAMWVIGSRKKLSHIQTEQLLRNIPAALISLREENHYTVDQWDVLEKAIGQQDDIVLLSDLDDKIPDCRPQIAESLTEGAFKILYRFRARINYLVLVGGDTGAMFLETIKGKKIELIGEIEDALPYSILTSHMQDCKPFVLVTKGGSIGDGDTLARISKWMRKGADDFL